MIDGFERGLLRFLRVPHEPDPPQGSAGSLLVFRAAPAFWRYKLLAWSLGQLPLAALALAAVFLLPAAAAKADMPPLLARAITLVAAATPLLLAVEVLSSFFVLRLDYRQRWYMVTDRSLRIRDGVLSVREMTMTFANVQNLAITQGPIQGLFGIADLEVKSAGGGGGAVGPHGERQVGADLHTGWLRGISDAERVRDLIRDRLRAYRSSGLGDHDEAEARPAPSSAAAAAVPLASLAAELADEARGLARAAERLASRPR